MNYDYKFYSVSEKGHTSGTNYDGWLLNDLRRYLISVGGSYGRVYEIYETYEVNRDQYQNITTFRRYRIGILNTGKGTWKSDKTGKTYKVNPKNGSTRRK